MTTCSYIDPSLLQENIYETAIFTDLKKGSRENNLIRASFDPNKKDYFRKVMDTMEVPGEYTGCKQTKAYFDVDNAIPKNHQYNEIEEIVKISTAIRDILNLDNSKDIRITEREEVRSVNKGGIDCNKYSYHFVVHNTRISKDTLKKLIIAKGYKSIFDMSVYNKNGCLYPIYSNKKRLKLEKGEKECKIINVPMFRPRTTYGPIQGEINESEYCPSYIEEGFKDYDIIFEDKPVQGPKRIDDARDDDDKDDQENNKYSSLNLQEIITHLKPKRATDYNSWIDGMYAIMNCCDAQNLKRKKTYELVDLFSALCPDQYDGDTVLEWCEKNYDKRREKGYRFKFILDWLKEDDPEFYTTLLKKDDNSYEAKKKEFEETDCKIKYPPMVIHQNTDGSLEMLTIPNAKETYNHITYKTVVKYKGEDQVTESKFITQWLNDPTLRIYDKYAFVPPPLKCDTSYLNTWRDLDIFKLPYEKDDTVLQRFNEYIVNLLGQEVADYIIAYFANRLQNPAQRNMVCIIIYGTEGDGKNRLLDIFKNIFGLQYFQELESAKQLFDTHSCFEKERLFICVNEARGKDNHENSDKLKARVTTDTITVNPKKIQPFTINNYCDYLMTTNNHNAVNINDDSRRYLFCESNRCYTRNTQFFVPFSNEIVDNPKALRVIAEYLRTFDVSKVISSGNFQDHIPKTEIMTTVKEYNQDKLLLFIIEGLLDQLNENDFIESDKMFSWWVEWADRTRSDIKFSKISFTTRLGMIIKKHNLNGIINSTKNSNSTKRGYKVNKDALKLYVHNVVNKN